jgi:hypothetical protein
MQWKFESLCFNLQSCAWSEELATYNMEDLEIRPPGLDRFCANLSKLFSSCDLMSYLWNRVTTVPSPWVVRVIKKIKQANPC